MKIDCVLCNATRKETLIYKDNIVSILSTKSMKGHKHRIMAVYNEHRSVASNKVNAHMLKELKKVGMNIFYAGYKFVIMSPKFGSVHEHAHFIATDLYPYALDYDQVLGTPWLEVVQVREWDFGEIKVNKNEDHKV